MANESGHRVRVWDLPTRLFHWLLVLLVIAAFVTINLGGNWVAWHFRIGYALLTLILFRVAWGFVGGRYARFSSFVVGPRRILAYLRGSPDAPRTPGHNPLGSLSVLALLAVIGVQASLGLFANDDIASEGPLARLVSKETSDLITGIHHRGKVAVLLLVGLHVAAIAFYRIARRENLVRPMLVGDKITDEPFEPTPDGAALRVRALAVASAAAVLVWWLVGGPGA